MPRVPDLPCTSCGKLLWRGSTSLPQGEAKCRACRKSTWQHGTRKGYRDNKCRCGECREWGTEVVRKYRRSLRAQGIKVPGNSGPWINPSVRHAVYERDGWVCQLCMEPVDRNADGQSNWYPSLDHVVPQSKGGGHDIVNLRTAHRWCNSIRGAEDYHADLFEEAS